MITAATAEIVAQLARWKANGFVAEYQLEQDADASGVVIRLPDQRMGGVGWAPGETSAAVLRKIRREFRLP